MFAKEDLCSTEWTGAVHRVLLAQPPETRLAEHVATGIHLEWLVQDVKTHGAQQVLIDLGQFRLSLKKLLIKTLWSSYICQQELCTKSLSFCEIFFSLCFCFSIRSRFLFLLLSFSRCLPALRFVGGSSSEEVEDSREASAWSDSVLLSSLSSDSSSRSSLSSFPLVSTVEDTFNKQSWLL